MAKPVTRTAAKTKSAAGRPERSGKGAKAGTRSGAARAGTRAVTRRAVTGRAIAGRDAAARGGAAAPAPGRTFTVIHLLSDSTGNLAQHMLKAFLTQFPPRAFDVRQHNFLNVPSRVEEALKRVQDEPGMVLHAMVSPGAKKVIRQTGKALGLPVCDLTGSFVQFIAGHSGIEPEANVRLLHDISDEYHQRIKALEFTLEHDDGLGLETLDQADIVLAGVSRTSKTPTSIYLAQQGFKVANVSLAKAVVPPRQLLELTRPTVVGLVIDPVRLSEIRTNRQQSWGMGDSSYNELDAVQAEVTWSRRLFAEKGWPVLDVTRRAVEETAGKIVEILKPAKSG